MKTSYKKLSVAGRSNGQTHQPAMPMRSAASEPHAAKINSTRLPNRARFRQRTRVSVALMLLRGPAGLLTALSYDARASRTWVARGLRVVRQRSFGALLGGGALRRSSAWRLAMGRPNAGDAFCSGLIVTRLRSSRNLLCSHHIRDRRSPLEHRPSWFPERCPLPHSLRLRHRSSRRRYIATCA